MAFCAVASMLPLMLSTSTAIPQSFGENQFPLDTMRRETTSLAIQATGAQNIHVPLRSQRNLSASVLQALPPTDEACWTAWSDWDESHCPHNNYEQESGKMITCGVGFVMSRLRRTASNPDCKQPTDAVPTAEYNSAPCKDASGNNLKPCVNKHEADIRGRLGDAWALAFQNAHNSLTRTHGLRERWQDTHTVVNPKLKLNTEWEGHLKQFHTDVDELIKHMHSLKEQAEADKKAAEAYVIPESSPAPPP